MRSSDYLVVIATTTVLLYTTVYEWGKKRGKKNIYCCYKWMGQEKRDQYEVRWSKWGDTLNAYKWISYRWKIEKNDRNSKTKLSQISQVVQKEKKRGSVGSYIFTFYSFNRCFCSKQLTVRPWGLWKASLQSSHHQPVPVSGTLPFTLKLPRARETSYNHAELWEGVKRDRIEEERGGER